MTKYANVYTYIYMNIYICIHQTMCRVWIDKSCSYGNMMDILNVTMNEVDSNMSFYSESQSVDCS